MRVRTKLIFLFLASGAFPIVEGLTAAYSLRVVGRDVERLQRYTQTDDLCGQIKAELARLPGPDALGVEGSRARAALVEHADRTLVLCRSLERLTTSPASRAAIERVTRAVEAYRASGRAYAAAAGRAGFPERDAVERAHVDLIAVQEEGVIEPVGHEARLATQRVVDRADRLDRWVTIGGLSLALLSWVVGAVVLARVTAHPVVKLLRAAREVGKGRLDTVVHVRTSDELGELAAAFNDMTARLRTVYEGLEAEVRKRTEELRQREVELERERRLAAVGRLAAGVAHEVSNPLTVIAGAAEGLLDRAKDPALAGAPGFVDFPDYLETIESEAYRLKKVVRRLLDFSRQKPTVLVPFDLGLVARDAVSLARLDPRARERGLRLELEGPLPVKGDPDALKEALLNLLFNALQAVAGGAGPTAGEGGGVSLRGGRAGEQVWVEVADTGVGIAPQDLDRLFEPFFTTRGSEGTGLGLALVYGTVTRHGGTITAESDGPGRGARFRVLLPAWAPGPGEELPAELPGSSSDELMEPLA
ncbi:MAG: HAMP domain-containing histidine kinase [Planctomycetes bacterium]|nr:HAMP domain-containing histidine kinase [Planctomycetota bacterium]